MLMRSSVRASAGHIESMRPLVLLLSFLVLVCSDYRLNVRAEDDATSDEPAQEEEEEDNEGPPARSATASTTTATG